MENLPYIPLRDYPCLRPTKSYQPYGKFGLVGLGRSINGTIHVRVLPSPTNSYGNFGWKVGRSIWGTT